MLIRLIVADPALRAAIAEQLTLSAPASLRLQENESLTVPFAGDPPAAVIVDAPLVDPKALALLRALQENGRKSKIFLLGESNEAAEHLVAESFAKPLRLGHLLARIHFYLQASRAQAGPFAFGPFRLEPQARQAVVDKTGAVIRLTEKETHLLEYLGRSEKPVSREELLAAIWGYDARIDTHTLETHIYRLRRKLDPAGAGASVIVAVHGAYRLAPAP